MGSHPLDGAWAKLDRSRHHFDNLHECIARLFATKAENAPAGYRYDPDRQELVVLRPQTTAIDPGLPLVLGDCVHNARSALDHLVFQLAILNNAPPNAARKTQFPSVLAELISKISLAVKSHHSLPLLP
jgi:hypothetical protein